mmetsp:Transcript_42820/g.69619  ORF Transcript_42820/g.69619 Transcript_42820/m.69619 type:complete len:321 (+) Transcript_42820:85-1047(+)
MRKSAHAKAVAAMATKLSDKKILEDANILKYLDGFKQANISCRDLIELPETGTAFKGKLGELVKNAGLEKRGHLARLHRTLRNFRDLISKAAADLLEEQLKTWCSIKSIIVIERAGAKVVNGEYHRSSEDYSGRPMWKKVDDEKLCIWYRTENGGHWRLGRTNDYYYLAQAPSNSLLPPMLGWVNAKDVYNGQYRRLANRDAIDPVPQMWAREGKKTGSLIVSGAGAAEINGEYIQTGKYHERNQYNQVKDPSFYLWYRREEGGHWRLGKSSNYWYINRSGTKDPPSSGWELAKSVFGGRYRAHNNNATNPAPTIALNPS